MDWIQVITVIGVNASIIIWMVNKLDNDIKSLGNRLDGHATRIDQLYVMFCKMQEESSRKWSELKAETDKKFYDLLKEEKK